MGSELAVTVTIACEYEPSFDIEDFVRRVFPLKQISHGTFEFNFVDPDAIVALNEAHLGKDYVTDIITFNLGNAQDIFGDVYICVEKAKENADLYKQSLEEELKLLLIHGILHLLDYTDYTDEEKAVMDVEQRRILECVNHA